MPGFWDGQDLSPNALDHARREAVRRTDYIDLASSNPTHQGLIFPPAILRDGANTYWENRRYEPDPLGFPAAREAISGYYAERRPSLFVPPEQIVITASTSEAYSLLFALLAEPGDNILAPLITYPLFEFLAAIHHVELRPYRMREDAGWALDAESLTYARDDRTRAILMVTPHNPTGMVVHEALGVLDELALPLICDEVFAPFTYGVPDVPPVGALHPRVPVFHLNGISKMFALPDMKLGWIALNEPAYAQWGARLELLNDTFLGANSLTQHLLPTLFAQGGQFVDAMVGQVRANLDYALARFGSLPHVAAQRPDGGYYLFLRIDTDEDEETLVMRLLAAGLNVHPGYFYGYTRGVHLMLSALTTPEVFSEGIERLINELAAP